MAFEDKNITNFERQAILLRNLYPGLADDAESDEIALLAEEHLDQFVQKGVWFLDAGQTEDEEGAGDGLTLYSFRKDGGMIYSAFQRTYGIDLQTADLHWWRFVSLFMDLDDTAFFGLIGLRRRLKTGKASKEEKEAARSLGKLIEVDAVDNRTLEEKEIEAEFKRLNEARKANKKK